MILNPWRTFVQWAKGKPLDVILECNKKVVLTLVHSLAAEIILVMLVLGSLLLTCSPVHAKVYIAEPLLVAQPSYVGMEIYVYKPYNMPKGWYVTLDGYPVFKNKDGVWVYGTSIGPNLTPTNYIVGSVVPSMAGIAPWVQPAQISELRKTPTPEVFAVRQAAPPASMLAQGETTSTWIPDWTFNSKFMAIGRWKTTVDRMGMLRNPATAVAWSGKYPKVIYVWTGKIWHQVNARDDFQTPQRTLTRARAEIVKVTQRDGLKWYAQDMPVLAQQTTAWGYYWMGEIVTSTNGIY